ncbi:hypothetical protein MKX03_014604 [Papaver bracteatum]|nr:hypothetical protein MKX03_014604 [Papaver bracteatum]
MENKKGGVIATLTTKSRMFSNRTGYLIRGNKIDKKKNQEQNDVKFADMNKDTIELAIAASEALVISEIVKGDSASFPVASVVDIALRVKQARNSVCSDGLDRISDFVAMEFSETDLLSDLDEDDMADAFDDVGLSATQLDTMCCSSSVKRNECSSLQNISFVVVTPHVENQYGCDGETQNVDAKPQLFDYNDICNENEFEDALAMGSNLSKCSPGYVPQHKLCTDPSLDLNTHFHQSIHKILSTLEEPEDVAAIVDVDITTKAVPKYFIGETSFFSESADVIQDENSVAMPGFLSQIASLPSVAYDGFCGTTNSERIEVSQNICSSNSLADPLCSIVPCSISYTNTDVITTNQKITENGAGKNWYTQLGWERSLQSTRGLHCKFPHGEDVFLNTNGEGSTATCHRRLSSLKNYSTLGLSLAANSEEIADCFKPSHIKDSTKILFTESSACEYYGKDHDGPAIAKPTFLCLQSKGQKFSNNTKVLNVESTARAELMEFKNLNGCEDLGRAKKKVRFSEAEILLGRANLHTKCVSSRITRTRKISKGSGLLSDIRCDEVDTYPSTWKIKDKTKMIFQGLEFLLTGFTSQRQTKLGQLISKHGGFVLSEVPSPSRGLKGSKCKHRPLPIVISSRKSRATKFLYGCAINAFLLKVNWLTDSVASGSVLPPQKYMIFSNQYGSKFASIGWPVCCNNKAGIFDGVGIMLHGKPEFCSKFAKVVKVSSIFLTLLLMHFEGSRSVCSQFMFHDKSMIKCFQHGGGQLFKTLQWLIQSLETENISLGGIVAEDDSRTSRHLRKCASEQRLQMMPVSWIVNSLRLGQLLPIEEKHQFPSLPKSRSPELFSAMEQG